MKEKWFKDRKVPEEKRFRWSQITQHASLSLLTRVGVVLGVTMETAEGSSVEVKKEGEDEWIAGVKRNHSSTGSPRCGASGRAVVCHNGRTSRDEICIFMSITHTHTCSHLLLASRSLPLLFWWLWSGGGIINLWTTSSWWADVSRRCKSVNKMRAHVPYVWVCVCVDE